MTIDPLVGRHRRPPYSTTHATGAMSIPIGIWLGMSGSCRPIDAIADPNHEEHDGETAMVAVGGFRHGVAPARN